jgi:hypothetical protein
LVSGNAITGSEEKVMAVTTKDYIEFTLSYSLISDGVAEKDCLPEQSNPFFNLRILTRFGVLIL